MKFEKNQLVAYLPKDADGNVYKVEIGKIKTLDEEMGVAWVWYHSGGTAACTSLKDLMHIENAEYFKENELNSL